MPASPTISDSWPAAWSVPKRGKRGGTPFCRPALGVVQALREGRMTVAEAWESGLNFRTFLGLRNKRADRRLLRLWEWAMELPQVAKLGDDALRESLGHMEALAYAVIARTPVRKSPRVAPSCRRSRRKGTGPSRTDLRAALEAGRR